MARNPVYSINGVETVNPNVKVYQTKPEISTKDWTNAFKWNSNNHSMIQVFSSQDIFCTSDEVSKLSKAECRQFIKNIENFKWFSFDAMIFDINRIRVIKLNREEWENSECTCSHWQKNYKCNHVISLATRLRLASFSTVAYSIPLQHKRKKGAPKKMASALVIQPNDLQEEEGVQVCSSDEEAPLTHQAEVVVQVAPKKRGRPPKITPSNAKKSKFN